MEVRSSSCTDYLKTAQKVFEGCGMDSDGGLPVSKLMDKFSAYVPPDRSEDLQSMLDPEQRNPTISAHELAGVLEKYGEKQHKIEFDDSINLRNGSTLDSDSGISSDMGHQLLEELQSELRDRRQMEHRLRCRLDAVERAHDDAVATLTRERDALRTDLAVLRDEKLTLLRVRAECEESGERLASAEAALEASRREADSLRRKLRAETGNVDRLETETASLQALLSKSKDECHRINDMYAARQAALLLENETFKSNYADLNTRFQEQEEFLQQTLKEKVLLEMEMADLLNRSMRDHRPADKSYEVSCTEQQILSALDSLNIDSEREEMSYGELYMTDVKIERGRPSLFDELLRVDSFHRFLPDDKCADENLNKDGTEEESNGGIHNDVSEAKDEKNNLEEYDRDNKVHYTNNVKEINNNEKKCVEEIIEKSYCDTDVINCDQELNRKINNDNMIHSKFNSKDLNNIIRCETQLNCTCNNKEIYIEQDTNTKIHNLTKDVSIQVDNEQINIRDYNCDKCVEKVLTVKELHLSLDKCEKTISAMHADITQYEKNLTVLQMNFDSVEGKNKKSQNIIELLRKKIEYLETMLQAQIVDKGARRNVDVQTCVSTVNAGTQADESCVECVERSLTVPSTTSTRIRNFFWDSMKSILQMLAVLCLLGALVFLYNVSHYNFSSRRCVRNNAIVPWSWLGIGDLLDILFRVEYTGEIPM